jgi:hypothetical protein
MVNQSELSVAAQAQPAPAVTWIEPFDSSEPTLLLAGEMS